jgi:hypothetical protein
MMARMEIMLGKNSEQTPLYRPFAVKFIAGI